MLSRNKAGGIAKEIADHLHLVEHVAALQTAQKEMSIAISDLSTHLRKVEADLAVIRAEVKLESLKEAQSMVLAVQGGLNQRLEDLAVKVGVMQAQVRNPYIDGQPPEAVARAVLISQVTAGPD